MNTKIYSIIAYFHDFVQAQGKDFKIIILTFFGLALVIIMTVPFHFNDYALVSSVFGVMFALIFYGLTSCKNAIEDQQPQHQTQENQ
jgi:hypothetical protein